MKTRIFHIPIFVPHKGCPHDCVFCNQRKITGRTNEMTPSEAKQIIDSHLFTIEKYNPEGSYRVEVAFFGGSFTAIEKKKQTELLSVANSYLVSGRIHGIRCSTRPDAIDNEILANCKNYGLTAIELGVQSADEEVLALSDRGHSFDDVVKASKLIKLYNLELGLQMMTGLPGDTYNKSIDTARKIVELKPDNVRIYPTLVMEDTRLMDMYKSGEYTPQSLDEAVLRTADIAEICINEDIEILRISLQTTDGVNADTVKGPYHAAFAELVYSEIEKRKIEKHIIENGISNSTLEIKTPVVSQVVGHKKSNKEYFKRKYNVNLKIIPVKR